MGNRQKITGRASSVPAGLAAGATVNAVITGGGTALMALLLERESMSWGTAGYGIMAMILASSFLGAMTAAGRIKRQRLLVSVMSGGLYFAMLLAATALFFGGKYQAVGVTAVLIAGGSGCAALPASGQGKGRRKFK